MTNLTQSFVHDHHHTITSNEKTFIQEFSESLENLELMYPRFYMYNDVFSMHITSANHYSWLFKVSFETCINSSAFLSCVLEELMLSRYKMIYTFGNRNLLHKNVFACMQQRSVMKWLKMSVQNHQIILTKSPWKLLLSWHMFSLWSSFKKAEADLSKTINVTISTTDGFYWAWRSRK